MRENSNQVVTKFLHPIAQVLWKFPLFKLFCKTCLKIDTSLDREIPLLVLLLIVVVLRIPNFFEPYWYGDEAIYLTIGNALSEGSRLYADIVDHKTPLIYFLAMVPNQFWFRVLLLGWMIIATTAFYTFALRLFKKVWPACLSTLIFVILTTLPWFEGNIPNGELFVMGFILFAGSLLSRTSYFSALVDSSSKNNQAKQLSHNWLIYFFAGILFGLAILTKVPALFDVAAFLAIGWFSITNKISLTALSTKAKRTFFATQFLAVFAITFAVILSIGASILYFYSRGTLQAYLNFGLLYNFHYVQTWVPQFNYAWLQIAYTLPVKLSLTVFVLILLTLLRELFKPRTQFILSWFVLALFASLLSNRPYPHYFLQVVPPLALLLGELLINAKKLLQKSSTKITTYTAIISSLFMIGVFIGVLTTLEVGLYPTMKYYQRTISYLTGSMSQNAYNESFSGRMKDNYHAAEIIMNSDDPYLFIWGTNPELYALAKKIPTGRFTVSFHIKDLKVYDETMQAVLAQKPHFIVVMKNESEPLIGLQDLLTQEYILNTNFHDFELWKKQTTHAL